MGGKLSVKNGRRMAGGKPIPMSQFALPGANGGAGGYPVDTVKRARNALSRVAQFGTDAEKSKVRSAVKRRFSQIKVGGVQNHSNRFNLANMTCPNCGYEMKDSDGDYDQDDSREGSLGGPALQAQPGELRTPQRSRASSTGVRPQSVRGASSGNMGLANGSGRSINLSRRLPVRQPADLVVGRAEDGGTVIRHRHGGSEIGRMKHNDDGTWTPVVSGRDLHPHSIQQAAIREMVGVYNREAAAQPQAPAQTPLMQQYGVQVGLANADDTDTDDTDTSGNGLTPRGQQIYKKLTGKGVSPKVAMMMAKRSQNGPPGRKTS